MTNRPHAVPCPPKAFLQNGGTLTELQERYGITVRRHNSYPNLVMLKYSQIDSPMGDPLVQECRGLILDEDDSWRVVAWPFKKFFNYGEGHATPIDWTTAVVQEKLDGSLMILYHYDEKWHVASSGVPDASGEVMGTNMTFQQLFWETWKRMDFAEPQGMYKGCTFMFELMSPYNRIVVPHREPRLSLLGMRNIWSGTQMPIYYKTSLNPVRTFPLGSFEDVLKTFDAMDPLSQEGYVIVDGDFNRVKVKHPGYVALHHMKSTFSVKRLVEVIRHGESAEVLTHFPEWKLPFEQVTAAYDALVLSLEQDHRELESLKGNRKDFALAAKVSTYPPVHFHLLDGHAKSVREALKDVQIDKLIALLGVKEVVLEGAI